MNILGLSALDPSAFGHDSSVAILDDDSNLFDFENNKIWHKNTIVDWAWI